MRSWRKTLGIWLLSRFVGVPVPWEAARQKDGAALLAYEHRRLLALAHAGEAVPPVLAFDGHTLVTGDVGPTLEHRLGQLPEAERLPLMCAASADLARFHARGQWHGGAQSRNITWDGQRFARLDFEEQLRPGLSLPMVQIYDLIQLVLSLSRHFERLGPPAVQAVLQAYCQVAEQAHWTGTDARPDLAGFLSHLLPRIRRVQRLAAWSDRLHTSRELQRLRTVLDGLQAFVDASR